MSLDITSLIKNDGALCPACGRVHRGKLRDCVIGDDAINALPALIKKYGGTRAFVLCDRDTYKAAGEAVTKVLDGEKIPYDLHVIERTHPVPDERTVGEAVMYRRADDDIVVAVGGGVINDTAKIVAATKNVPDIIVGTAPSMDGFASATSSMERGGLKVSLDSKCPDAVIGDTAVLASAPKHLIRSGVGDMLAKYVSIAEWRISNVINGEYYCPYVASLVEESLTKVVRNADGALHGDKNAVAAVMEGLVVSGLTMNYAGVSRPASGMEHYISHITDMRALEFGTPSDYHGIQCGIAALTVVREYKKLARLTPDREKALAAVASFGAEKWNCHLRERLGKAAEKLIELDKTERKYDLEKHASRLERIIANWDKIKEIIASLPDPDELERFMKSIGHPTEPEEIGLTKEDWREAFAMAKDIRDKYVLGKLMWDMGIEKSE